MRAWEGRGECARARRRGGALLSPGGGMRRASILAWLDSSSAAAWSVRPTHPALPRRLLPRPNLQLPEGRPLRDAIDVEIEEMKRARGRQ